MMRRPEEALRFVREGGVRLGNNHYTHIANVATASDFAALAECVEARAPLASHKALGESLSNPHCYAALCDVALTSMYTEDELGDYFLGVLISLHEDEDTWQRRTMSELYKEITDSAYQGACCGSNPLPAIYKKAYIERFYPYHRYPAQIKKRAVEAVGRREPLVALRKEFNEKYRKSSHDSFLMWLDNCVLEEVGEDGFAAYIRDMAGRYAAGIPGRSALQLSCRRLTAYIFGYPWNPVESYRKHDSRSNHRLGDYRRLHELLARELLPYTCAATSRRAATYDFLGLSAEECSAYDEMAGRADRSPIPAGVLVAGDAQLAVPELPGGVSLGELLAEYDGFFADRYLAPDSPRGPIPPLHRFRRDFREHLESEDERMLAAFKKTMRAPALESAFNEHLETKVADLRRLMFDGNADEMASDKALVWIYYPNGEGYAGNSIDLSVLDGAAALQRAAREFMRFLYREAAESGVPRAERRVPDTMNLLTKVLSLLADEYRIDSPEGIGEPHMLAVLSHLSKEGYAPGMLKRFMSSCRKFFRFLMACGRLDEDPTSNLSVRSGPGYSKSTPEIPEDVLSFIEGHIDEVGSRACRLMFRLAMETGWRLSDIRSIRVEGITGEDPASGMPLVKTRSPKTAASRTRLCLGDKIFAVVSPGLHGEIEAYIKETSALREMYGIETLFFTITNGVKTDFPAATFNAAINRLLERHGIRSIDEGYEAFTSRQTRKSVAVELITSGAPPAAVQKQLGHVSQATTQRFYAEVRRKRLAELDSEFYRRKFGLLIDSGRLDLYTEEERRWLYVDFCTNRRNVELGVCSKHPSEGRCADLGSISCASCPKLCTGKAFRGRWEELHGDSSRLLAEFEGKYAELGIPEDEYRAYTEYAQERALNDRYRAVLDAIERGDAHA